jgi:hypothetical protein
MSWNILCCQVTVLFFVASSPLYDSILVEIKCITVHRNTTVFSNCWRKQQHVLALFRVGHHQVATGISEKTHTLQCGHQEWGNEILCYNVSWCPQCSICVFSDIPASTWWWLTQKRAETCSRLVQQFENTVVLQRSYTHLISTYQYWIIQRGWCHQRLVTKFNGFRSELLHGIVTFNCCVKLIRIYSLTFRNHASYI